MLRVPKSVLESSGFQPGEGKRREIVKILVERVSPGTSIVEHIFANYYPADRRAEVYLGRLEHAQSETFVVRKAWRYNPTSFVDDFNGSKSLNLQNMTLVGEADDVWMEVDGRKIRFARRKMTTFGSMVNLAVEIFEGGPSVKFEYDGRSAVARFKGHPVIEFMQICGEELEIQYLQSKDEKHIYRLNLKNG